MNRREFGRTTAAGLAGFALPQTRETARTYRYVHLDVFTDRKLAGNQLYVFVEPAGLDVETMQAFTRESNLSECTFVLPAEQPGTHRRVRIFTRAAETPFAGHPTIGTAFALAHNGVLQPTMAQTVFGLGVGPTNIDLEWKNGALAFTWMTQLKPTFGKQIDDASAIASAIGLSAEGGVRQPGVPAGQEVNCGSTFFVVPLATRKAVDAAVLDRAKVDAMFAAAGIQRRGIYVFSIEKAQDDATAYSRLLGSGGIEDPATGSAAGPAGCFAAQYGLVPADRPVVFLQGVLVRRPSRIYVNVTKGTGEITGVKVGGSAVVVGEGTMSSDIGER